jgi:hypothetical protein
MAFDLKFTGLAYEKQEHEAEIIIGSFSEKLLIPTTYWDVLDYQKQWRSAANTILTSEPNSASALITSMYEPKNANFITLWSIYREGGTVFIQNKLLFMKDIKGSFKLEKMHEYIGSRVNVNQDGEKISEWSCTIDELKEFRDRMQPS